MQTCRPDSVDLLDSVEVRGELLQPRRQLLVAVDVLLVPLAGLLLEPAKHRRLSTSAKQAE